MQSHGEGRLPVENRAGKSDMVIPRETVDLLIAEHKKRPDSPYLFMSPITGDMFHPDAIGRVHKKLLDQAGIGHAVRFHDLRHTFAIPALQNGVDVKTLSGILGHYSAGFTLDTYTHATTKMQMEAADKVGGFMVQSMYHRAVQKSRNH